MKDLTEILAYEWGLNMVTITKGRNGYPEGLYKAVSGFGCYPEAEDFAERIDGEVVLLARRDGREFWSNLGRKYESIRIDDSWIDDDEELIQADGAGDWWRNQWDLIKDMTWESPDELGSHIQRIESIYNMIEQMSDNQQLKINGRYQCEVIPMESMHYHDDDVTDYMIAVIEL